MEATQIDKNDPNHYDVIVIGVGGMGSATVCELAERGKKVLGIDRYDIPNNMGSSHGATRIIRMAYYQGADYVTLVRSAYDLWRKLEQKTGETLLHITGSLDAGLPDSEIVQGSLQSCKEHNLEHQVLSGSELCEKFPGYHFPEEIQGIFQADGGVLFADRIIKAYVLLAKAAGAEIHDNEQVLQWQAVGDAAKVVTNHGEYTADKLVITAGPWFSKMMSHLPEMVAPERQVVAWFDPIKPELFNPSHFPVFNLLLEEGHYYGFPVYDKTGFKFGRAHHLNEIIDPDTMNREVSEYDKQIVRQGVEKFFPEGAGEMLDSATCIYTNTEDEHFIIGTLPESPQVSFAGGFSGHGFKFCSVMGEIMADLAEFGETKHDIELFRLDRFTQS
ncbi:N-methyl-L-tryptophan oxidase [Sessilibacter corallicola]|uniref:N-methyl-L-tryptophan oxidase n=1 Tax=Sessilibacter corallicola TaxID=2904075 RepID=UPI001E514F33|nr:N-methyl-L-tryptophan oxidase [Sessilibacter corallicola]MCE2027042.1 N-methyl-L-tryptophan oxidase [Sessilibacter corallicola]